MLVLYEKSGIPNFLLVLLFAGLSIILSLKISGYFIDNSYDGQAYHQEGIIQLYKGWNPVYEQLDTTTLPKFSRLLNSYTKTPWIIAASIYKVTGNIEYGKATDFILFFAVFALTLSTISYFIKDFGTKVVFALLLCLNPVVIYQSLSFYIDGLVYLTIIGLICMLTKIYFEHKQIFYYALVAFAVVLSTLKLTGIIYAALALLVFFFILDISEKTETLNYYKKYIFVTGFLALFVGFNPLVTSTISHGNPFYGVFGEFGESIETTNVSKELQKVPSPFRWLVSTQLESSNIRGSNIETSDFVWKIPFTIKEVEKTAFTQQNTKVGGFGPLFGGVLLVSVVALALVLFKLKGNYITLIILATVCISLVVGASAVKVGSVARFVPHVYVFPFLFILYLIKVNKITKYFSYILLFLLAYNVYFVSMVFFPYSHNVNARVKENLASLETEYSGKNVNVDFGDYRSTRIKLDKLGINYFEVDSSNKQECKTTKRIIYSNITVFCE